MASFPLGFVPVDDDILSLEIPNAFRDIFLRDESTAVEWSVQALMSLQKILGLVPIIKAKGHEACAVVEKLRELRKVRQRSHLPFGDATAKVDEILIVDRTADLATPLLNALTYEGALADRYNFDAGLVQVCGWYCHYYYYYCCCCCCCCCYCCCCCSWTMEL